MKKPVFYIGSFLILVIITIIYGIVKYTPKNKPSDTQTNQTNIGIVEKITQNVSPNKEEEINLNAITERKENINDKSVDYLEIKDKIHDTIEYDISSMSDDELKVYVEKAINEDDIDKKMSLYQRISDGNYSDKMSLMVHLGTNIANECKKPELKSIFYSGAIGDILFLLTNDMNEAKKKELINISELLFEKTVNITKNNPWQKEFEYSWHNAFLSLQEVYYKKNKNADYSLELIDRYNEIINNVNPPNAEEIRHNIHANIAYGIASDIIYNENPGSILLSDNSIKRLKEYAQSFSDDQEVPMLEMIPKFEKIYLKPYIMKALEYYKNASKKHGLTNKTGR